MSASVEMLSVPRDVGFVEQWYEYAREGHFWFDWRMRASLAQARAVGLPLREELRGLEIGAGTGVLRDGWEAATAWTVDITDLNQEALRRARPSRGRTLYYDVTERRAELRERYDVVFVFDVIEHIEQTRPFLEAALWHLRPGGHLLVNVPAEPRLLSAYDTVVGHLRRYLPETLAAELDGMGMEIRDVRYWGCVLVPLLMIRKRLVRGMTETDVVRTGFQPPGRLVNATLRALGRIETALLRRPPIGTSLLMAARRRA